MKIVGQIKAILGLDKKPFEQGIKGAEKSTSAFANSVKKIGGLIGGAFAVSKIISFAKEASKLAGEAEGIRQAYSKISNSNIESLRKSVKGTVSDMELMRSTVEAATLGLDASKMPELFAFAAQRAKETGQSVDYLVDSIVKGIGRKSPLILDNLGISAIALKEAMGGVSLAEASVEQVTAAVAEIAREATGSLDEFANSALTTKEKTEQLQAETDNLKVAFGNLVNEIVGAASPALRKITKELTSELNDLSTVVGSDKLSGWQKFSTVMGVFTGNAATAKKAAEILKNEETELAGQTENATEAIKKQGEATPPVIKNIAWYKEQITALKKSIDETLPSHEAERQAIYDKIRAYEDIVDASKDVRKAGSDLVPQKLEGLTPTINVDPIKAALADVTTSFISQQEIMRAQSQANFTLMEGYMRGYYQTQLTQASETFGSIGQIMGGVSELYKAQKDSELAKAEQIAKQQGKSEQWLAKRKADINKKYAKKERQLALAMAIVNTAQGVTKALAQGGVAGIVLGALVAAAGAVQIATIQSQGMAKGGIVPAGFPNDTYPAALSSGETVLPPKALPNLGGGQREELVTRIDARSLSVILKRYDSDKVRFT